MPEAIDDEGGVFDNATLVQTYAVIHWDPTDNRQPLRHTVAEGCGASRPDSTRQPSAGGYAKSVYLRCVLILTGRGMSGITDGRPVCTGRQ